MVYAGCRCQLYWIKPRGDGALLWVTPHTHSNSSRTSGTEGRRAKNSRPGIVYLFTTRAICFHSPFQQDILIGSPVQLKLLSMKGPRHTLAKGRWAYKGKGCEPHYKRDRKNPSLLLEKPTGHQLPNKWLNMIRFCKNKQELMKL